MRNSKDDDGITIMEMPGIGIMITMMIIVIITLRRTREAGEFVLSI